MSKINCNLPSPKINYKKGNSEVYSFAKSLGYNNLQSIIISNRFEDEEAVDESLLTSVLNLKFSNLNPPSYLKDIDIAVERLWQAFQNKEVIGIETDHDCDGQTSHAVIYYNLTVRFGYPSHLIKSYIGNRLTEGYGLTQKLAERIINDDNPPSLVITADNGSSDEKRIKYLKEHNIDVIITDHHQIPLDGVPKSAVACLNPTRKDCEYPDPCIAGCMVAWLLMVAFRQKLIDVGYLDKDCATLLDSLDYVAVGTVADCVSLSKSFNNRTVIAYGIHLIKKRLRPCWQALWPNDFNVAFLSSEDLAFQVAPLLNSDGRLATGLNSVSFLLAKDIANAHEWLDFLKKKNLERKSIQKSILDEAIFEASKQFQKGKSTISIYQKSGNAGVHGIAASRIKDMFGRTTVFLTDKYIDEGSEQSLITGSVRGADGINVKKVLDNIHQSDKDMFVAYGGHRAAAGLTIKAEYLLNFIEKFEEKHSEFIDNPLTDPVVYADYDISGMDISMELYNSISKLEPYGRGFEPPSFTLEAMLLSFEFCGTDNQHCRTILGLNSGRTIKAMWFGKNLMDIHKLDLKTGNKVVCVVTIKHNIFQKNRSIELHINHMQNKL